MKKYREVSEYIAEKYSSEDNSKDNMYWYNLNKRTHDSFKMNLENHLYNIGMESRYELSDNFEDVWNNGSSNTLTLTIDGFDYDMGSDHDRIKPYGYFPINIRVNGVGASCVRRFKSIQALVKSVLNDAKSEVK